MKRKHQEWQARMNSYGFILCAAGLGWCGALIVNVGAPLGWLLIVAAMCCLVIAYGEQQIACQMVPKGWDVVDTSHD
jgi:hypothetical protein